MRPTPAELKRIRDTIAFAGRMSDNIFHIGPFSMGIDGVLSWLPGVGDAYSILAGGFIILQGARAGVAPRILASAAALMGLRTIIGSVPLTGSAVADLFTAHRWAAAMIVREIDRMLGVGTGAAATGWSGAATA